MENLNNNVTSIGYAEDEDARIERFERDVEADLEVMLALLNARAAKDDMTRAAKVYDHLILQLMALYVSPAALDRYRQGFSSDEIDAIRKRNAETGGVVGAENGMMAALKRIAASHHRNRQDDYQDFVEHLYLRWQYVDMSNGAGIEALSADEVNVVRE